MNSKEDAIKKVLLEKGPLRFKEISRLTGVSEPTVAKWLRRMEKEGKIMRTVLPEKSGVYYVLIDRKFKEDMYTVRDLLKMIFKTSEEYAEKYKIPLTLALAYAAGEAIFMITLGVRDEERRRFILTGILLELEKFVLNTIKCSEFIQELEEYFVRLKENLSKVSDEELDKLIKEKESQVEKVIEEWFDHLKNSLEETTTK